MKKHFDLQRFILLFVRELILNKLSILIMGAALTLLFLGWDYVWRYIHMSVYIKHYFVYPAAAVFYCLAITSSVFKELDSSQKKIEYLMIPASVLEKYLVKYIYSTFVLIIMSIAAISTASIIVELLKVLSLPGKSMSSIMNHYTYAQLVLVLSYYFPLQAYFFFGAVYFRKLEFIKTLTMIIAMYGIIYMFYSTVLDPFTYIIGTKYSYVLSVNSIEYTKDLASVIRFVTVSVLPLALLVVGYLRLKETEAADGI
jgi:hypothetical protein